jgi:dienelactone hydrolase
MHARSLTGRYLATLVMTWLAIGLFFPRPALGTEGHLAAIARQYAGSFMAAAFDDVEDHYTPDMKAALTPSASRELRDALIARNGAVAQIGDAWFEDRIQTYTRYRVPLFFENGPLDMRIVFDTQERIAGMFFVEHSEPPPSPDSTVRETDVVVGAPETGLPGILALPDGTGPFPVVILIHGSGPSDRDETIGPNKPFRDLAWGLAKRGIASLRYDKRSFARPDDLAAVGDRLTVKEEVIDDALAGLALLRSRPEIEHDAIFIVGHSLGGTLAPRIAEFEPRPGGVVVLAGMTLPLPEKMLEQTEYIVSLDGVVTPAEHQRVTEIKAAVAAIRKDLSEDPIARGYYLGAPLAYYRDLEDYDAPAKLASLELPCLVLQGARDYQVTLDDFALWRDSLSGSKNACLHVYDDLDHLFRPGTGPAGPSDYDVHGAVDPAVIDCIARWVHTHACCSE